MLIRSLTPQQAAEIALAIAVLEWKKSNFFLK